MSTSSGSNGSKEPSLAARYTTASILIALLSIWTYYAYYCYPPQLNNSFDLTNESSLPSSTLLPTTTHHGPLIPLTLTTIYLTSLPLLNYITTHYLYKYEMKTLLIESMIIYNIAQVLYNAWMVYTIIVAILYNNHPFIGSRHIHGPSLTSGASYAVYVHYCNKYLEFIDTYFMILRGKNNQVRGLLLSHHTRCFFIYLL